MDYFFDKHTELTLEQSEDYHELDLAKLFNQQVETFYSLPKRRRHKQEITFSPSSAGKCLRQLYYEFTLAPEDEEEIIPEHERVPRNGEGVHAVTLADYAKMEDRLREDGLPVHFRLVADELDGRRSFDVGGTPVTLKGRCDGVLQMLDDDGNVIKTIIFEKKTMDKKANLHKIIKANEPKHDHQLQATAYSLMWDIDDIIFEYESLQKNKWSDTDPKYPDIHHIHFKPKPHEKAILLRRFAKVVEAVNAQIIPDAELDKCMFCPFKTQCHLDGGYKD